MTRVLFYLQHLLGVGHVRRSAVLVKEMLRRGLEICVIDGGVPVPGIDFGDAERVQLPPIRAREGKTFHLLDAEGHSVGGEYWRARRKLLLDTFHRVRPQLLLFELFPFGRLRFCRELLPLLKAAAQQGCPCWSSLRDVLPERPREESRFMASLACHYFERILVHGDPSLMPLERSFPEIERIRNRLIYSGLVVDRVPPPAAVRSGGVVVSAGGGAVGERLLRTALTARAHTHYADRLWHLLCGVYMPETVVAELREAAPSGVRVQVFHQDFLQLLAEAEVSVSQAGYNTTSELLALRVPAVLVPPSTVKGNEQVERARRLAACGCARVVEEATLDPVSLASAVDAAVLPAATFDLGGAERSAALVKDRILSGSTPVPRQATG